MKMKKVVKPSKLTIPKDIDFHYLKTGSYRTFHVDGVFGGPTPNGNIYAELFVERTPTPQQITHQVNKDGSLGNELGREGKGGLIREIEAGIVFDLATAEKIQAWLAAKIEQIKTIREVK